MIEDKKEGIKIAENEDEALWSRIVDARKSSIEEMKKRITVEKIFLKAAKRELKNIQKKLK